MKRLFVVSLLVLLASVGLVVAIEYDPGYVLISYGLHTLETSVWVGVAAIALFLFLLWLLFTSIRRLFSQSAVMKRWLSGRGHRRSQRQTTEGLIAFIEGNWARAQRVLSRSAGKSDTPLVNYLVAARASNALGNDKQVKEFLRKAEQSTEGADIAVGLTQAELQLHNGALEQSLATLTRLRRNTDRHPHILNLLKSVYIGLKDWDNLAELLPQLRRHKVVSKEELQALSVQASQERLQAAAATKKNRLDNTKLVWQQLPKAVQSESSVVACYAQLLIAADDQTEAEKVLLQQLRRHWSAELITLYGQVAGADVSKQLVQAESWLRERNNDAALLLCLGRLSLRNQLWGKAREYFESSLALEEQPHSCVELARLLTKLGEHQKSNEWFHRGLALSAEALPVLPLPNKV